MKIIKQNDSLGGLIFKQNGTGKAMKQNYDFGKGWKSNAPMAGIFIDIPVNWPIGSSFFYGHFTKCPEQFTSTSRALIQASPILNTINYLQSGTSLITCYFQNTLPGAASSNANLSMINYYGSGYKIFSGSNSIVNKGTNIMLNSITNLRLNSYGGATGKSVTSDLIIYDRALTDDEVLYLNNKGLGNEPLNLFKIKYWFRLDGAEILNTGGADFVGIRDSSGNNGHRPIAGLPVGSLEDQLAYANVNLFEIW